jgi:hypothetical protein
LNFISASPFGPFTTSNGAFFISFATSSYFLPINLFAENIVPFGLVIACLFAGVPTIVFPSLSTATIEGVVLFPSAFGITFASPHSMNATQELVVPKSIQIIFHIIF